MRHPIKYLQEESPQKQGRKQEDIAKKHINSGIVYFDKGDLSTDEYNIDVKKVVTQKVFQFKLDKIEKHYNESLPKTPAYLIYIGKYVLKVIVEKL